MSSSGGGGGMESSFNTWAAGFQDWIGQLKADPGRTLVKGATGLGTGGSYDPTTGSWEDNTLIHGLKETAGALDGANAARNAGYAEADALRQQQAQDALNLANKQQQDKVSDQQASSGAQGLRNTAAAVSGRAFSAGTGSMVPIGSSLGVGSPERDFLGL